jgi:hypothetical protein
MTCMTWTKLGLGLSAGLGAALSLVGCKETTSSCNVRTAGLAMLTEVTATSESAVRVKTTLLVGGDESNTYATLDGCDELFAEADDEREKMDEVDDGVYEAKFDLGAEGTRYRVILEREQDETADGNTGKLPAPFDVTSDFGSDEISRADDDLEVTWDPSASGDDMSLEIEDDAGGCIYDGDFNIGGDPGSYIVGKGEIESTSSQDPETCDVTGRLIREREGSTDSELDSESWFKLRQTRKFGFVSAP